jgi:hypothetical protein
VELTVISSADQVTPEWLTATLRVAGALPQGQVVGIAPGEPTRTFASRTWRLRVAYSDDAPAAAPARLFLKCSSPELAPGEYRSEGIEREIVFYRTVAPAMAEAPSVPCYAAAYSPDSGAAHLLLLDVSDTHQPGREPPDEGQPAQAVERLACLHAFWWDHPRLGVDVGRIPTQAEREQEWLDAEKAVGRFLLAVGEQLDPAWRLAYRRVVRSLPYLYRRHRQGRQLTLAHGDAHLGNFLFPREGVARPAYLIDWQFWHATIGGTDLAFMIATDWDPAIRRRLEGPLLRRYHEVLLQGGVKGYGWEACWDDYRLSVILVSLFIPVWRATVFQWEPDMTTVAQAMAAFEELGCADLLENP